MEGEPLSSKDAVLLTHNPRLVLDGLMLLGRTLRSTRMVLATGPEVPSDEARELARGTGIEVRDLTGGFVAGQESALVNQLNGRDGVPSDPLVPVYRRGVDDRATLVLNAETLAQLALAVRYGAEWFRSVGTPTDPGTHLATITASRPETVSHPGVLEIARGTPLRSVLSAAGTSMARVGGVLVGGYHGAWIPADHLDVALTVDELAHFGAAPGAGVLHVLDIDDCPLEAAARIADYLAGQSARQCGPCVNGLPRMSATLAALARPGDRPGLVPEVERLRGLVNGRGACAHPDGTARFVASTMRVFHHHVDDHLGGACHARAR
jgi:NADH:ubiquinone oxidoreductase subunit F (NADH-binding)